MNSSLKLLLSNNTDTYSLIPIPAGEPIAKKAIRDERIKANTEEVSNSP
tara:strand:+ start:337 stop:483 length:147 start_codon:yes stop_codon:yes gene_type:complete